MLSQRRQNVGSIEPYLMAIVACHWLTTSLFEDWGGAWSIGPRYFVDVIPYLVYLLIPLFELHVLAKTSLRYAFIASVALERAHPIPLRSKYLSVHVEWQTTSTRRCARQEMGLGRSAIPARLLSGQGIGRSGSGVLAE